MAPETRQRLLSASVSGRYDLFLGLGGGLALLGVILFVVAAGGDGHDRAWQLFHVNWIYFTGLAGGSVAIAAIHKAVHAKWSGVVIRFAEAAVAFLPISFLGLIAIFTVGYEPIYGHMQSQMAALSPGKQWWLSHPVMFTRLAVALGALYFLGWKLIRTDMVPDLFATRDLVSGGKKQLYANWSKDYDDSPAARARNLYQLRVLGPIVIVVYCLAFTMVAFDGIMALQPHWFSNLLGGWYFMGSILGAHMILTHMAWYGGAHIGILDLITKRQRRDMGMLCFGFTIFWTYLMWAQFQVIWYANLPEETGFVFMRLWGEWRPVGAAVLIGMFVIPFFGLIGTWTKTRRPAMALLATVSLCALWLERYLLVVPSVSEASGPVFGLPELAPTLLFLGLYLLTYGLFGRTFPMVSPRLAAITLAKEAGH